MLQPLLSRPPSHVRTLVIVAIAPLALLGLAFCSYLFLIPLGATILWWPTGPARWLALIATLALFSVFGHRCVRNALIVWRSHRSIAIDHIMFAAGRLIWSAAAILLAMRL
jgi:hypothetical protein